MAHERNCTVCGTTYEYCPRCKQYEFLPRWKMNYCSERCKSIYDIINSYAFGHTDKIDAKRMLDALDTSVVKNEELLRHIEVINASEKIEVIPEVENSEEKPKKRRKSIFVDEKSADEEIVNVD